MPLGYYLKDKESLWEFSQPESRYYTADPKEAPRLLELVHELTQQNGWFALGYLSYEASNGFTSYLSHRDPQALVFDFTLFKTRRVLSLPKSQGGLVLTEPRALWSPTRYQAAFQKVKAYLEAGDTYQVNLTFPLVGKVGGQGSYLDLFMRLHQAQRGQYGGLYAGRNRVIMGLSPELFFRKDGSQLKALPMKGTRKRTGVEELDRSMAQELHASEKDQAENLMIVDMIRNDLGQIATPGTVKVPELFRVESYPTVLQMVSEVKAKSEANLAKVFGALYPCASITGAPKPRTMEIIREVEDYPRGVYTGAFGWMGPEDRSVFGVGIRTLEIEPKSKQYVFGVGSGVVWDSNGEAEYKESLDKGRFLSAGRRDFDLLEALVLKSDGSLPHLDQHLERMKRTARLLGERLPLDFMKKRILLATQHWRVKEDRKLRLALGPKGRLNIRLQGPAKAPQHFLWTLADEPIKGPEFFLRHKTSRREIYEEAKKTNPKADQIVLYTAKGYLTEGTSANLFVKLNGSWYTPPESLPLLPGCARVRYMSQNKASERLLHLQDLKNAEAVAFTNDVRGWVDAKLISK